MRLPGSLRPVVSVRGLGPWLTGSAGPRVRWRNHHVQSGPLCMRSGPWATLTAGHRYKCIVIRPESYKFNAAIALIQPESDSRPYRFRFAFVRKPIVFQPLPGSELGRRRNPIRRYFLEYATYVVKNRAIPEIDDGLKPVQRRILHTLFEIDDGKYHKVANVVGQTMRFHPHGDQSIFGALVSLANKDLFIDKQGNFGTVLTAARPRPRATSNAGSRPSPGKCCSARKSRST